MKATIIFIAFLSTVGSIFAQPWLSKLPKLQTDKKYTFYDYKNAFDSYWKPYNVIDGFYFQEGIKKRAYGWKQFQRWAWNMESEIEVESGNFPEKTAQQVYNQYLIDNPDSKSPLSANWVNLGIDSTDNNGLGRLNCIEFHPSDTNTYWVGSPTGGLWVTHDNGDNWTCLTDNNASLGISDIAIPPDYDSSGIIYIATGDKDYGGYNCIGVLKSTDFGFTWNPTGLSYLSQSNHCITRLLMDPNDSEVLIAATSDGLYKTVNGGMNWDTKLTSKTFIDLKCKPNDFNTFYGSTNEASTQDLNIYVSEDGGNTWTLSLNLSAYGRIEIAVSPDQPTWVYAIAGDYTGLNGVFKSTNNGANFTKIYDGTISCHNLLGYDTCSPGGMIYYALCIAVSPYNANSIVVGGIWTFCSSDGGINWSIKQNSHVDQHYLKYRSDNKLFACHDGGINVSANNGFNWVNKSNGLIINEMYRLGVSQTNSNEVITGLQDNGTQLLTNGSWKMTGGGDGMECIIDFSDINIQYQSWQNGSFIRTTNHWATTLMITPPGLDGTGSWITPFVMDPIDPKVIYLAYNDVWKSDNYGTTWLKISSLNETSPLRVLAISPSNNQVIYVSRSNKMWKTINGGESWSIVIDSEGPQILSIAVKNDDPNTIWISFGSFDNDRVYQSVDGGISWSNISEGLPNIPIESIIQNKQSVFETHLYAGTDIGVFFKKDNDNWVPYNTNLPNVKVSELEILYNSDLSQSKLRAATYGRGLWESELYEVLLNVDMYDNTDLIKISSNPVKDILIMESNSLSTNIDFDIITQFGQIVDQGSFDSKIYFPVSHLSKGVYIIRFKLDSSTIMKKFIII